MLAVHPLEWLERSACNSFALSKTNFLKSVRICSLLECILMPCYLATTQIVSCIWCKCFLFICVLLRLLPISWPWLTTAETVTSSVLFEMVTQWRRDRRHGNTGVAGNHRVCAPDLRTWLYGLPIWLSFLGQVPVAYYHKSPYPSRVVIVTKGAGWISHERFDLKQPNFTRTCRPDMTSQVTSRVGCYSDKCVKNAITDYFESNVLETVQSRIVNEDCITNLPDITNVICYFRYAAKYNGISYESASYRSSQHCPLIRPRLTQDCHQ